MLIYNEIKETVYMTIPNELAWAAGLFEGEGCFTTSTYKKTGYVQCRAKLNMTDEDVVKRFHHIIGVGTVIFVPVRSPGTLPQWQWGVSKISSVKLVFELLSPWFGERRKHQGLDVIARSEKYKESRRKFHRKIV